jgi:hypothetical protein
MKWSKRLTRKGATIAPNLKPYYVSRHLRGAGILNILEPGDKPPNPVESAHEQVAFKSMLRSFLVDPRTASNTQRPSHQYLKRRDVISASHSPGRSAATTRCLHETAYRTAPILLARPDVSDITTIFVDGLRHLHSKNEPRP